MPASTCAASFTDRSAFSGPNSASCSQAVEQPQEASVLYVSDDDQLNDVDNFLKVSLATSYRVYNPFDWCTSSCAQEFEEDCPEVATAAADQGKSEEEAMTKLVGQALIKMDELDANESEESKEVADDDSFVLPRTHEELMAMRERGEVCAHNEDQHTHLGLCRS